MRFPQPFAILTLLYTLASTTYSLGINCRGSSQCSKLFINVNVDNIVASFDYLVNNGSLSAPGLKLPGGPLNHAFRIYAGDNIACVQNANYAAGSICMFAQGNVPVDGVDGATIGKRISDLNYHGCEFCGSVPLSGDNNPDAMGILTVNYVYHKGCNGLCEGFYEAGSVAR